MSSKLKYRTCIITAILLLNSISIFILMPNHVKAQENEGETKLYFTKYNLSEDFEEIPELSIISPESKNYSSFPPIFISHNKCIKNNCYCKSAYHGQSTLAITL